MQVGRLQIATVRMFAILVGVQLGSVRATWIQWEAGRQSDVGKAVFSVDGNWSIDGVPQIFHYWKVNFEAAVEWREGDLLAVDGKQQQLNYTLGSDAYKPVKIEFRYSHILGYAPLQLVDSLGDGVYASVFIGDLDGKNAEFKPSQVAYQLQLFRNSAPVRCENHQGGVDFQAAPGMTFAHRPVISWAIDSVASDVFIEDAIVRGVPPAGSRKESHLCCTAFGQGAQSWDRVVLTVSDNTGRGIIRKGTRLRIMLSGIPVARSKHLIPTTSDPISPIVVYDTSTPLHFDITGLSFSHDDGECEVGSDPDNALVEGDITERKSLTPESRSYQFLLGSNRQVPSLEFLTAELQSEEFTNRQPAVVLNYKELHATPLVSLLTDAWSRSPKFDSGSRPNGRPMWESSIALCDKLDSDDQGITIEFESKTFRGRHLNQRRVLFGCVRDKGDNPKPAIWMQRAKSPEVLGDDFGVVEGANDNLNCDVVGYRFGKSGTLPVLWRQQSQEWLSHDLPVRRLAREGRALDLNDDGFACGYMELALADSPIRVPCLWKPNGEQHELVVLPVSEETVGSAATAINDNGVIVGYYETSDIGSRACSWKPTKSGYAFVDLEEFGVARGINVLGHIVGGSDVGSYLWQCGKPFDLSKITGAPGQSRSLGITHSGDLILIDTDGKRVLLSPITAMDLK